MAYDPTKPEKYWDISVPYSYSDIPIKMDFTGRGARKTSRSVMSFTKWAEAGKGNFLFVRRFKGETKGKSGESKGALKSFGKNLSFYYPTVFNFSVKGMDIYNFDKIVGQAANLTTSMIEKGSMLADDERPVRSLFDEAIIDNPDYRYRNWDEPSTLLNLHDSICRPYGNTSRAELLILGNLYSQNNPYFDYFKVPNIEYPQRIWTCPNRVAMVHVGYECDYNYKIDVQFEKINKHTKYGDYAVGNNMFLKKGDFVMPKRPKGAIPRMTLQYRHQVIQVWQFEDKYRMWWITTQLSNKFKLLPYYAMVHEDHTINNLLINNYQKKWMLENFRKDYANNFCFFQNALTNKIFIDILNMTR